MSMRFAIVIFVVGLACVAMPSLANAADPGMPGNARVELSQGAGGEIQVVVRWEASANLDADYEVWRRTPFDLSFQVTEPYADVPASARLADGSFEFVDPAPFSIPERPCYQIGATVGDPIQSSALAGCIPTLPDEMEGLHLSAMPGPYANSWYITGTGFRPGVRVQLQELSCAIAPCLGADLQVSTQIQTGIDGRFSVFTTLPANSSAAMRNLVAFEPGWLTSQFASAPTTDVVGSHSGAVSGYPLSLRTGVPAVDTVLAALGSNDPAAVADLMQLQKLPAFSDGRIVDAVPSITCGNGDYLTIVAPGDTPARRLTFVASDFIGLRIYAVFAVKQNPDGWLAMKGATHAIVLANANEGYQPRAALLAVNQTGIVGFGQPCGSPPTYYLRDVDSFVVSPSVSLAPPAAGNAVMVEGRDADRVNHLTGTALVAISTFLACYWIVRSRVKQSA